MDKWDAKQDSGGSSRGGSMTSVSASVSASDYDSEDGAVRKRSSFFRRPRRLSFSRRNSSRSVDMDNDSTMLEGNYWDDIKLVVMHYSSLLNRKKGLGEDGIYSVPAHSSLDPDAVHPNWGELFFDVIYVAVLFLCGNILADSLKTEQYIGLYYVFCAFTALYECWTLKLHYSSRFNCNDVFHKLFDIIEALLVALIAGHLTTSVATFEDVSNGQLLGFCACKLLHQIFHAARWGELLWMSPSKRAQSKARSTIVELGIGAIPLVVAVCLASFRYRAVYIVSCLLMSSLLQLADEIVRQFGCGNGLIKRVSDPVEMHIGYLVHRYGEWTMILLGEGVMQIILVPFNEYEDGFLRYSTFVLSFLLLAGLRILYYSSQPFIADAHALKQSSSRGFFWLMLQPVESTLMTSVGIALKLVLLNDSKIGKDGYSRYSWFLCGSASMLLVLIWVSSLLHLGLKREFGVPDNNESSASLTSSLDDEFFGMRVRRVKILAYLWKISLSVSVSIFPLFGLSSVALVTACVCTIIAQIVTHDVLHRFTKDLENQEDTMREQQFELRDPTKADSSDTNLSNPDSDPDSDSDSGSGSGDSSKKDEGGEQHSSADSFRMKIKDDPNEKPGMQQQPTGLLGMFGKSRRNLLAKSKSGKSLAQSKSSKSVSEEDAPPPPRPGTGPWGAVLPKNVRATLASVQRKQTASATGSKRNLKLQQEQQLKQDLLELFEKHGAKNVAYGIKAIATQQLSEQLLHKRPSEMSGLAAAAAAARKHGKHGPKRAEASKSSPHLGSE